MHYLRQSGVSWALWLHKIQAVRDTKKNTQDANLNPTLETLELREYRSQEILGVRKQFINRLFFKQTSCLLSQKSVYPSQLESGMTKETA